MTTATRIGVSYSLEFVSKATDLKDEDGIDCGKPNYLLAYETRNSGLALSIKLQFSNGREATERVTVKENGQKTEEEIQVKAGIFSWPILQENPFMLDTQGLKQDTLTKIVNQQGQVVQEWVQNVH